MEKRKFMFESKAAFLDAAKPITIKIGETGILSAKPKEMGTGSVGFNATGKITLEIGGVVQDYQVGLNITAIGSKEAE